MATKVYSEGGFVILESDVKNKIDVTAFSFSFNGLSTVLIDQENERTFHDSTANIQDELGAPVGNKAAVEAYLIALKPASGGGGGGGNVVVTNNPDPSAAAKQDQQTALIQQIVENNKEVSEGYYFTFNDIENQNNKLTFPVTCELVANPLTGVGQSVPSATYADFDALITAFNAGITYYTIEKRTADSFYLLPSTIEIATESEVTNIAFNTGFISRVFRFFRVNKGAYPSDKITVSRTANELKRLETGTGLSYTKQYSIAPSGSQTFYAWKEISIDCDAPNNELSIQSIDGTFTGVTFPYIKLNGQIVSGIDQKASSVQKIPIKVVNTSATNTNVITVTITK